MKALKIFLITLSCIILLPIIIVLLLAFTADMKEPALTIDIEDYVVVEKQDTLFCNDSYLIQNESDMWELYIRGSGQDKGAKQGALTKDLMRYQEDEFIDQINRIIPSEFYLSFLKISLKAFNRNLREHVPEEYRNEIVAMSEFCTHEYDAIGNPYERQLNYHAAHDIGHTMQQYMLVGCSSFATWGENTKDEKMIVGRNFDFYVGDEFAKNKIITFAVPDNGYKYVSVSWAGMVGVLSGMNEKGITVTINAAKGSMPTSSATPISIITRSILQYSSSIDEAYEIAKSFQSFVNESILVGSSTEKRSVLIEKTPHAIDMYETTRQDIVSTNHYQSETFLNDETNQDNIANSDSKYRFDRLRELLDSHEQIDHNIAVNILRDRYGLNGRNIGLANEKSLNQSIAHHSVVFSPTDSMFWVSTNPWQSGKFLCYDLKGFFNDTAYPCLVDSLSVPEDHDFINNDYPRILEWRAQMKVINQAIDDESRLSEKELIEDFANKNPHHYLTWKLLGDYCLTFEKNALAEQYFTRALKCEIPYKNDREDIESIIEELND